MIRGSKGHFNINCVNCLKLHNEIQVIPLVFITQLFIIQKQLKQLFALIPFDPHIIEIICYFYVGAHPCFLFIDTYPLFPSNAIKESYKILFVLLGFIISSIYPLSSASETFIYLSLYSSIR